MTVSPQFATAGVGETKTFEVKLRDPVLDKGSYYLRLEGPGRMFGKFANGLTEMDVSLEKGEIKTIPVTVSPPGLGQYDITVNARHLVYSSPAPAGIGTDSCTEGASLSMLVQTEITSGSVKLYSAPSLDWMTVLLLVLSASLIFARGKLF